MTIPFSTHINGKPTFFVEKIIKSIEENETTNFDVKWMMKLVNSGLFDFDKYDNVQPKIHTIRDDVHNRFRPGVIIDGFINSRTKKMLRIMPRVPIISTQKVFMTYNFNDVIEISVNDKYICNTLEFAQNDGFETWEDFFNFFYPKIMANPDKFYKGKIIHWTDLKY